MTTSRPVDLVQRRFPAAPRRAWAAFTAILLSIAVAATGLLLVPRPARAFDAGVGSRPILIAAGDIATCGSAGTRATADLVTSIQGTVQTLGDNAYPDGSLRAFLACYNTTWGRFAYRTHADAGNHDWQTANAAGYFAYFGDRAGGTGHPWYSYALGTWHIVVLDADCPQVGGCGPTSEQGRWLAADLAAHPAACILAAWHQPRFTEGETGDDTDTAPFWQALYAAHAEIVLNGHEHDYERYAPQAPDGSPDPAGIREFIVGTGGEATEAFAGHAPNLEARKTGVHGVLVLDLEPGRYTWQFRPVAGQSFTDTGSGTCH